MSVNVVDFPLYSNVIVMCFGHVDIFCRNSFLKKGKKITVARFFENSAVPKNDTHIIYTRIIKVVRDKIPPRARSKFIEKSSVFTG